MNGRVSRWRSDTTWDERIAMDARLIEERLTEEQKRLIAELPVAIEQSFHVEFVLVIGSRARGDHRLDSDLDVYVEAVGIPDDPNRAPHLSNGDFDVLVVPAGVLMRNVPAGEEFALGVACEGLASYDTGAFRETMIALDELGLVP